MTQKQNAVTKAPLWLKIYLDRGSEGFLHGEKSARLAGYKGAGNTLRSIASKNAKKFAPIISKWLDEEGLSENCLKLKLLSLIDAKETKFFAHEGIVTDERVVESLEIQRRSLDMAIKMKGMLAPEKHEHDVSERVLRQLLMGLPEDYRKAVIESLQREKDD